MLNLKKFKRFKSFASEVALNSVAFTMFIATQQFIAFPVIAKINYLDFGNIITIFAIMNIVSSLLGNGLGVNKLLKQDQKGTGESGDFLLLILLFSLFSLLVGFLISYFIFSLPIFDSFFISILFSLSTIRCYYVYIYRLKDNVKDIFKFNMIYSVVLSCMIAMMAFNVPLKWFWCFLIAEIGVLIFNLINTNIFVDKIATSKGFGKLFKDTIYMSLNIGFSYTVNLSDRLILNPILGPKSVAVYYSSSVITKIGAMVLTPLSGLFLSKLAKVDISKIKKINKIVFGFSILFIIFYSLFLVIITPFILMFLYPQYYVDAKKIIVYTSIASAILASTNIMKQIIFKFYSPQLNTKLSLVYGISFLAIGLASVHYFGLKGFALSTVILNFLYFLCICYMLKALEKRVDLKFLKKI